MISSLLSSAIVAVFDKPKVDYHALAPEIILAGGICLVLLVDLFVSESKRWITSTLAGFTLIASVIPVVTLGADRRRHPQRCSAAGT